MFSIWTVIKWFEYQVNGDFIIMHAKHYVLWMINNSLVGKSQHYKRNLVILLIRLAVFWKYHCSHAKLLRKESDIGLVQAQFRYVYSNIVQFVFQFCFYTEAKDEEYLKQCFAEGPSNEYAGDGL